MPIHVVVRRLYARLMPHVQPPSRHGTYHFSRLPAGSLRLISQKVQAITPDRRYALIQTQVAA